MSHQTSSMTSSSGSAKVHSAQAENVHVQSIFRTETQSKVSMENSKKITDLMSRLGTTHLQVDEYARKRTDEISEAVTESIKKLLPIHNYNSNNFLLMLIYAHLTLKMNSNVNYKIMLLDLMLKKQLYLLNLKKNLMFDKNLFLKQLVHVLMILMKKLIV